MSDESGAYFEAFPPRQTARVTLECGHIRLMRWNAAVMGTGSHTACFVCSETEPGRNRVRQVVDRADAFTHWFDSMNSKRDIR